MPWPVRWMKLSPKPACTNTSRAAASTSSAVTPGATDGISTEVNGRELEEGAPVIVAAVNGTAPAAKKATPFGGGGRGPRI